MVSKNLKLLDIMTERVATFGELRSIVNSGEFDYFFGKPVYRFSEDTARKEPLC